MTNGKQHSVAELEAELLRLNTLVRKRRKQLAFLERCPNKHCECRAVWHEVVEQQLAGQMGKISRKVGTKPKGSPKKQKSQS